MNRSGKEQTVSLTQVMVDSKSARMYYRDLMSGKVSQRWLVHRKRLV